MLTLIWSMFSCFCFQSCSALWSSRLRKREQVHALIVHLYVYLACVNFCLFLFLLVSGVGCDLWLWHTLDFSFNLLPKPNLFSSMLFLYEFLFFLLLKSVLFCKFVHQYLSHVMRIFFLPYANTKGADHPAHPRSLISIFVVCFLHSIISLVSIFEISSL